MCCGLFLWARKFLFLYLLWERAQRLAAHGISALAVTTSLTQPHYFSCFFSFLSFFVWLGQQVSDASRWNKFLRPQAFTGQAITKTTWSWPVNKMPAAGTYYWGFFIWMVYWPHKKIKRKGHCGQFMTIHRLNPQFH